MLINHLFSNACEFTLNFHSIAYFIIVSGERYNIWCSLWSVYYLPQSVDLMASLESRYHHNFATKVISHIIVLLILITVDALRSWNIHCWLICYSDVAIAHFIVHYFVKHHVIWNLLSGHQTTIVPQTAATN